LPALHAAQRTDGWLSPDALERIAAHLRVPKSEVWAVASHYPEFRLARPGRRIVRVCTGVSCRARGGQDLVGACERALGIAAGRTTADGAVTLEEMDCAFACSVAPVVEVDHAYRGRVAPGDIDALLSAPARAGHRQEVPAAVALASGSPVSRAPVSGSPAQRLAALAGDADARSTVARLIVGVGACSLAVGAGETLAALRAEVARRGLSFAVVAAGCNGMCWAAPTVTVAREGQSPRVTGPVTAAAVPRLLDALASNALGDDAGREFMAPQHRVLLERCGVTDPGDIADALRRGAYAAFAQALTDGKPERVIEEVRAAGLTGRGGAYFQTAVKWAGCRAARGTPKFIVVNAEEGEPGIFKDRHLMEGDPHRLLEAMLLAAFAAGASRGILYIHGEAELSAQRVATALAQAHAHGLVGHRILGSDFSLEVEIRRGAGGFVLGERRRAESLEGSGGVPVSSRPGSSASRPSSTTSRRWAVPSIVARGGAWFASLGGGRGTKLFGLSGHLKRPGVVEMELGCTLRTLIDTVGGGSSTGRPIRAAVVGGPSGSIVHPRQFDEPLIPRGPVNPGTGGVVTLDDQTSVRDAVRTLLAFNTRESCGKCTPCREGTARLLAMLDGPVDEAGVKALSEVIQVASLCGLGQAAPFAVLSGLAEFPGEFGVS
jgi:NADH-quinone oxidoreductase subunit F